MSLDPRTVTDEQVGTRLRDAAVDPRPDDFLPPTNAGEPGELGNPHGPSVVSPEVHATEGVHPVRPGAVSSDPAVQSAEETAHVEAWQAATGTPVLSPETETVVAGATTTLTATAGTPDATLTGWSTSDPEIATVADGVVTGVAAGEAVITATWSDGSAASSTVTVTAA